MKRAPIEESSFETKGHNHCQKAVAHLADARKAQAKVERKLQGAKDHHTKALRRLLQVPDGHAGKDLLAARVDRIGRILARFHPEVKL